MKLLVSTLLFATILGVQGEREAKGASCNRKKVDHCNERLFMIGDDTFVFPENLEQVNKRCREIKDLDKCVKDFSNKCLTRDAKQSVAVLSYGVTKTNKGYCTTGKRKAIFAELGRCLNQHKKKLDPMMWTMSTAFGQISKFSNGKGMDKKKIPLACCHYYDFKLISTEYVSGVCSHKVASEYEAILNGYANEVLNLFCGEYTEDSDKCSGLIRKHKVDSTYKPNLPKVFVLPMVDIFDSLPR